MTWSGQYKVSACPHPSKTYEKQDVRVKGEGVCGWTGAGKVGGGDPGKPLRKRPQLLGLQAGGCSAPLVDVGSAARDVRCCRAGEGPMFPGSQFKSCLPLQKRVMCGTTILELMRS